VRFTGKVQRKPLALLKAIVALGGEGVREDRLSEILWPEAEGDAAHLALTTAVHRLRRLLADERALTRQGGRISLDEQTCWVDVWALERLLDRSEARLHGSVAGGGWTETVRLVDRASTLYRGAFLADEPDAPWAIPTADRLRRRLVRVLSEVGRRWTEAAQWDAAAREYERAVDVDSCAEGCYRQLMTIYRRLGRPAEVEAIYERCRQSLADVLGTTPSAETEGLRDVGPS
jgi:DNA-binding SARP family transcriptional activator